MKNIKTYEGFSSNVYEDEIISVSRATDGVGEIVVKSTGAVVHYEFDQDSNSYWTDSATDNGQHSCETRDEMVQYVLDNLDYFGGK